MNFTIALLAALYVTPGSPQETPAPDFSHDCFLGHWEGSERRLVYEGPRRTPFFVGTPGKGLRRSGTVEISTGAASEDDITVREAETVVVREMCELHDVFSEDGRVLAVVASGETIKVRWATCREGVCDLEVKGRLLRAMPDECSTTGGDFAQKAEWWVPVLRGAETGWVQGHLGWVVETRCVGPDEGANLRAARWHRG